MSEGAYINVMLKYFQYYQADAVKGKSISLTQQALSCTNGLGKALDLTATGFASCINCLLVLASSAPAHELKLKSVVNSCISISCLQASAIDLLVHSLLTNQ